MSTTDNDDEAPSKALEPPGSCAERTNLSLPHGPIGNTPGGRAQRAIMLQLLLTDRNPTWSRAELELEISDIPPHDIQDALRTLTQEGLVRLDGELLSAARAVRHLDRLGMVSI
jgi:hypothetical protein